jgi:flagellar biosynthesis protein FlhG
MRAEAPIVGVISGKGGVGKTNLVANVALSLASQGRRVLAVDGDLGMSSLDVMLGMTPDRTAAHVLSGECTLEEAIVEGPRGLHVLPAASGRSDMHSLRPLALARLLVPLYRASANYELVLVDVGPGVSSTVVSLAAACDRLLLVATPEPASLADAYAVLKVLTGEAVDVPVAIVMNAVRGENEARQAHARIGRVAAQFLNHEPALLDYVSRDPRLVDAVRLQRPVTEAFPSARSSQQYRRIASALLNSRTQRRLEVAGDIHSGSRAHGP